MNPTHKRLLGAAAAVAMGATTLIGAGAGTAGASDRKAYCDRAERPIWIEGPSRNMTSHGCSLPDNKRRWYIVEVDTLVQPHHTTEYLNGKVDRTVTLHDETIRCLGYTSDKDTVNWFGCVPN